MPIRGLEASAVELQFFSDASKAKKLGFGTLLNDHLAYSMWEDDFIEKYDPSIEFLELYAVTIGIYLWAHLMSNMSVILFTDNEAITCMINLTSSACPRCLILLRIIVLKGLKHNVRFLAKYIQGQKNLRADFLSRNKLEKFWQAAPSTTDPEPTPLPNELWPASKLFDDEFSKTIQYPFRKPAQKRRRSKRKKKTKNNTDSSQSSSGSSTLLTSYLTGVLENLKRRRHRKSTDDNYNSIWKNFNNFFIRLDDKPTRWEDRLALYLT